MNSEELQAAYKLAAQPYIDAPGPMTENCIAMRSWRYVFEVSSMCNLHCTLCHAGNRTGYEYHPGIMEDGLMQRCLDKMKTENPNAVVCAYVNSEPFLHPRLPEVIQAIKARGFRCEIATNGNHISRLDEVLAAKPDILTVSVSGATQEIYERAHRGGNIETVKKNVREIVEANKRGGHSTFLGVSYHMYNDNLGEEMAKMQQFCDELGILLMLSWGRTITIENTVQALRYLEVAEGGTVPPYPIGKNGLDLNKIMPPPKPEFLEGMKRLRFPPDRARKLYAKWPQSPVCLVSEVFTEIRWDGRVQLCAWTDDMRFTLGNYLDMSIQQIAEARRGHPLCAECMRYRLPYYFHICDPTKWDSGGEG